MKALILFACLPVMTSVPQDAEKPAWSCGSGRWLDSLTPEERFTWECWPQVLMRVRGAGTQIIGALDHPDQRVRRGARLYLDRYGARVTSRLKSSYPQADDGSREPIAAALAQQGEEPPERNIRRKEKLTPSELMTKILENERGMQQAYSKKLAEYGDEALCLLDPLRERVTSTDASERLRWLSCLLAIDSRSPATVDLLFQIAECDDRYARTRAAAALADNGPALADYLDRIERLIELEMLDETAVILRGGGPAVSALVPRMVARVQEGSAKKMQYPGNLNAALGRAGCCPEIVVPYLKEQLVPREKQARRWSERGVGTYEELLRDLGHRERWAAADALLSFGIQERQIAYRFYREQLSDLGRPQHHILVSWMERRLGLDNPQSSPSCDQVELYEPLIDLLTLAFYLENQATIGSVLEVLQAMSGHSELARTALVEALAHESESVRIEAARQIDSFQTAGERGLTLLIDLLEEEHEGQPQLDAIKALARMGEPAERAVPALLRHTVGRYRRNAIPLLVDLAPLDPRVARATVRLLHDRRSGRRDTEPLDPMFERVRPNLAAALEADLTDLATSGHAVWAAKHLGKEGCELLPLLLDLLDQKPQSSFERRTHDETIRAIGAVSDSDFELALRLATELLDQTVAGRTYPTDEKSPFVCAFTDLGEVSIAPLAALLVYPQPFLVRTCINALARIGRENGLARAVVFQFIETKGPAWLSESIAAAAQIGLPSVEHALRQIGSAE